MCLIKWWKNIFNFPTSRSYIWVITLNWSVYRKFQFCIFSAFLVPFHPLFLLVFIEKFFEYHFCRTKKEQTYFVGIRASKKWFPIDYAKELKQLSNGKGNILFAANISLPSNDMKTGFYRGASISLYFWHLIFIVFDNPVPISTECRGI